MAPPQEVHLDITLTELAGVMDDAVGRETGMAELVKQWLDGKAIERHLSTGSNWLREYAERLGIDPGPIHAVPREPIPDTAYGTDDVEPTTVTGIVRKYDRDNWDAARDCSTRIYVGGPRSRALPDEIKMDRRTTRKTLRRRLSAARKENKADIQVCRDALVALMDEAGWDEATRVTSDGYRIGRYTYRRFNARRYYEMVPEDRRPVQLMDVLDPWRDRHPDDIVAL